ncbi:MAG: hypothetical protein A3F90_16705 [Deltaproteobacteria bacterium RIFCSPLOWO2_12_FULL_60_19]|nr:MAG: hypothetical protein A3F90_16705 [Deltaproteobacteria bacterium RIFCSPLOWO2_12_FULL_60_19]
MEAVKFLEQPLHERGKILHDAYIAKPATLSLRKKTVLLTVIAEEDDEILVNRGLAFLRQARLLRLCTEAHEQEALLAYEDLTNLLLTSKSTIKRDLRSLRKQGLAVPVYRKKQRSMKGY